MIHMMAGARSRAISKELRSQLYVWGAQQHRPDIRNCTYGSWIMFYRQPYEIRTLHNLDVIKSGIIFKTKVDKSSTNPFEIRGYRVRFFNQNFYCFKLSKRTLHVWCTVHVHRRSNEWKAWKVWNIKPYYVLYRSINNKEPLWHFKITFIVTIMRSLHVINCLIHFDEVYANNSHLH